MAHSPDRAFAQILVLEDGQFTGHMCRMELRHLRYFCAVAEDGHVTRAAERLRVAQPALTQQIKALEQELGVPLLRRVGRNIELTEAGVAFWREAEAALKCVRAAVMAAQQTARGLAGRVAVGLTETASFAPPVTAVLTEARARWPRMEFSLMQARSNDLVPALVERRIDVSFMRSPAPEDDRLQAQPFLTEELVVALPAGHELARRRVLDLRDLAPKPLILPRGRFGDIGLRRQIDLAFAQCGQVLRVVQETPEYIMAINLVAAGIGAALVPSLLTGLRDDAVVYRRLRTKLCTDIIVVSRAGETSPVVINFLALAAEMAPSERGVAGRRLAEPEPRPVPRQRRTPLIDPGLQGSQLVVLRAAGRQQHAIERVESKGGR